MTVVEYRKYSKVNQKLSNIRKLPFKQYLKNKYLQSTKKIKSNDLISQDIFDILEDIEKENKIKE